MKKKKKKKKKNLFFFFFWHMVDCKHHTVEIWVSLRDERSSLEWWAGIFGQRERERDGERERHFFLLSP